MKGRGGLPKGEPNGSIPNKVVKVNIMQVTMCAMFYGD